MAWVTLHADHLGESQLILSAPVFCDPTGFEQPLLQADVGVFTVAEPTPTPTITPTPSITPTPEVTPTPTGTVPNPADLNGDGLIDGWDWFYFSLYWKMDSASADERCNMVDDATINAKDLIEFMLYYGNL